MSVSVDVRRSCEGVMAVRKLDGGDGRHVVVNVCRGEVSCLMEGEGQSASVGCWRRHRVAGWRTGLRYDGVPVCDVGELQRGALHYRCVLL
jgi:hypothetical protein